MPTPVDERYRNDPKFHQLVQILYGMIQQAEYTPTEIREACMLAQLQYESRCSRVTILSPELQREIAHRTSGSPAGILSNRWPVYDPPTR